MGPGVTRVWRHGTTEHPADHDRRGALRHLLTRRTSVKAFRNAQLTARESIRARGLEFHRHYAGSTACTPSRATLFTGQYPSLHGVTSTDGTAKQSSDPGMHWLDPDSVPTLGDWFRAGGYRTHYRGKWHVSFADLVDPGHP